MHVTAACAAGDHQGCRPLSSVALDGSVSVCACACHGARRDEPAAARGTGDQDAKAIGGAVGFLAALVLVVGTCSYLGSDGDETPVRRTQPAHVGSVVPLGGTPNGSYVTLGTTEDDYARFVTLLRAKDQLGFEAMLRAGQAFRVPVGTKARVIDRGFVRSEVRIEEGTYRGVAGWTASEMLDPP